MKKVLIFAAVFLSACNAVNIKPDSMDKSQLVYAYPGGYTMRFAIKQELEERGYKITVGNDKSIRGTTDAAGGNFELIGNSAPPNAKYLVKTMEEKPTFSPVWCLFNGFWWWKFNVSIADQKTGEELLAWTGRVCVNSSLRRLNRLMDELERK
ncbi:MAG: hypothetical protein LBL21_02075 [Rickettsiales bacterium]|jgi:hypothetical protein|nr:hypothetical protein [Rickettsiales bacterium]